jgi:AcrR family transcriptional regulator
VKRKRNKSAIPARQSATGVPASTRDRIIKRSIALFNRDGLRNVSIERIAADLKISPGNFTYHFPRKRQLIAAALEVLQERLRTALEPPTGVRTAQDGADYMLRIFRTIWDHRFFFNALTYVLTDRHLRREYSALQDWTIELIASDLAVLCDHGYLLLPTAPNTYKLLAENMWGLWLNWVRMQHILTPKAVTPDNLALYDCALHNWSMCQLWMRPDFARDLLLIFDETLLSQSTKPETAVRQ